MNRLVMVLVVIIGIWAACLTSALAQDAAMVVDIPGEAPVFLSKDKAGEPVELMAFLIRGDRMKLADGDVIVLNYFASGVREEITGPGDVTVGTDQSSVKGARVDRTEAVRIPDQVEVESKDAQKVGTVVIRGTDPPGLGPAGSALSARKDPYDVHTRLTAFLAEYSRPDKIIPYSLYYTVVSGDRPVFRWSALSGDMYYRLGIFDHRDHLVHRRELTDNQYVYDGPPLETGVDYNWTVEALSGAMKLGEGGGRFRLLPMDKRDNLFRLESEIRQRHGFSGNESRILLSMLYENYRLYDEAANVLDLLSTVQPENQRLAARLKLLNPARALN
jgi:hypothetical protein